MIAKKDTMAAKLSDGNSALVMSWHKNRAAGTNRLARSIWTGEMSTPVTKKRSASIAVPGTPQPQPRSRTGSPSSRNGISSVSQAAYPVLGFCSPGFSLDTPPASSRYSQEMGSYEYRDDAGGVSI